MKAKKILMQAARKRQYKNEIQKMSEAQAADLLRSLTGKEKSK